MYIICKPTYIAFLGHFFEKYCSIFFPCFSFILEKKRYAKTPCFLAGFFCLLHCFHCSEKQKSCLAKDAASEHRDFLIIMLFLENEANTSQRNMGYK